MCIDAVGRRVACPILYSVFCSRIEFPNMDRTCRKVERGLLVELPLTSLLAGSIVDADGRSLHSRIQKAMPPKPHYTMAFIPLRAIRGG